MNAVADDKEYRSPVRKLVRFFVRSRDAWKAKCQKAKMRIKRLSNGIQALQRSRDRWKSLAKQSQREARQLRRELDAQKNSL